LRLRGPCGAHDEFLLAATAQNLRKLVYDGSALASAPRSHGEAMKGGFATLSPLNAPGEYQLRMHIDVPSSGPQCPLLANHCCFCK
jgi:hypothetical protein